MGTQPKLRFNGRGVTMVRAGHLRYTSPKELRGKYVHRHMVEKLIEETPYSMRAFIPWPYEVHHMDYVKTHNCSCNFLLLSEALHSSLTADRARNDNGRFGRKFVPKWKPAPQYVLDLQEQLDDEVPF